MGEPMATDTGVLVVNAALNFVNLALAAWIVHMQKAAKNEVRRTRRTTRRVARRVNEVKQQTNGRLAELIQLLQEANNRLQASKERAAGKPRRSRVKTKPKPRPK